MDTTRLQKIFDSYLDKYDVINSAEHHEIYKWSAASGFQKYWDLDAADFGEMFKAAMEDAENIVSEASYQPVAGI